MHACFEALDGPGAKFLTCHKISCHDIYDMNYNEKLKELTEKFILEMESLKSKNQLLKIEKEKEDNRRKISLLEAGKYVKWVIDTPRDVNLHYIALDPIQTGE